MVALLLARYRVIVLASLFLLCYAVLLGRLWHEQVRRGADYAEKVSDQSIRRVRLPAIRGRLYSAEGKLLAGNAPNFGAVFHLNEMRLPGRRGKTIDHICAEAERLASALGRKLAFARIDVERHMNYRPAIPFPALDNLTDKELAILSEMTPAVPGLEIVAEPERRYPGGRLACHLIGFCGKDDPTEAEDRKEYSYYIPDLSGRDGLEKKLDTTIEIGAGYRGLQGEAGNKLLIVDAQNFVHEELGVSRPPQLGNDVQLTIDARAQEIAERLLSDNRGAFVLLDASDGAVMAMASSPGYDLMKFANGISRKDYQAFAKDPEKPFVNRALQAFMPGSIVKPLVALAALRAGASSGATVFCDGAAKIGNTRLRCWSWKYGGHGDQDMREAIKNSCNVYFVEQGRKLGLEKLSQIYSAAGFGRPTGVGLPESKGVFPSEKAKKQRWTEFDTCLISIGQGTFTITPLQAAVYAAAIANGGTIWRPYLVKAVYNHNHKLIYSPPPVKVGSLPATPDQLRVVREGMWRVVNDPKGSGNRAKSDVIELSGKTGTAQIAVAGGGKTRQGWFIGFGRKNGRIYALAITVEDAVGGGLDCAPLARRFFEEYLPPDAPPSQNQTPDSPPGRGPQ